MERMKKDEQKEILLMSESIKYFAERKQKRHQKEFMILGNLEKNIRQYVLFSLSVLL